MSEKQRLNREEIEELASNALMASGALEASAKSLAKAVASAEMDGIKSHGLVYVPIYCEHLLCGKVVGSAVPKVERPAKGAVVVDACSGFAHPAIDAGFSELVPAAKELGCKKGDYPVAEKLADTILSIPLYSELEDDQVHYVIEKIIQFCKQ